MSDHAKLSPSSSSRWMNCPGSVALCATVPEVSSVYADEGTFAHDIAAQCLDDGHDADRFVGTRSSCRRFTFDATMAEHVQTYLDAVRDTADGATLHTEEKVRLGKLTDRTWGTVDCWFVVGSVLHVFDLKFGAGVFVDVTSNSQCRIYALGALIGLPAAKQPRGGIRTVIYHVVQPRHFRGGHSFEEIGANDLFVWARERLLPAIEATDAPDAPTCAGDWCRFCPAKATCPTLKRTALEGAKEVFDDVDTLTPAASAPDPTTMSPEEIGQALAVFPAIEQWIAAVREHAHLVAARGTAIPGKKLVRKVGNRAWKNEDDVLLVLDLLLDDPYAARKLLSPAQAEKALPKNLRGIIAQLVHKPDRGSALVDSDDPRPSVPRADDLFPELLGE